MALNTFATPGDLQAWLDPDDAPDNATSLLRSATFLVALACFRSPFGDPPADPDAEVLNAATCAQAAAWTGAGIDPSTLALGVPLVKKSSIFTGNVEIDTSTQLAAQQAAIGKLAPEAIAILTAAGLIFEPVPLSADEFDSLPQWGQGRRWSSWPETLSGEVEWPFAGAWWS